MDTKVLDYRIIIEPEKSADGNVVYVAHCPTLGISDYGDSVEEVMASIKDGIQLAVESLVSEKLEVPTDDVQNQIITTARVNFPMGLNIAFG